MSTIPPLIRIFAFDINEPRSPAGNRTDAGGTFAFKYIVASGCQTANPSRPATTSGTLIFEGTKFDITDNNPPSHLASKPECLTFNLANSGVAISDMRLFLIDDSALKPGIWNHVGQAFMQIAPSGNVWFYRGTMPSGAFPRLTTSIPTTRNVSRQDGTAALAGQDDINSSEFVYLNLILPLGFPLGEFGVCGSGLLRFGLIFNYWANDFLLTF
jgi:hypothetical protein